MSRPTTPAPGPGPGPVPVPPARPVRAGEPPVITAAAVLHPRARTLRELDLALRAGTPLLSGPPPPREGEPGHPEVPGAWLTDFDLPSWADRHLPDAHERELLTRTAARAGLPVRSACCAALGALARARTTPAERAGTAVVVAGNNHALAHQSRAVLDYARTGRARAGHLLDCFDSDVLGALGQVTGCTREGWMTGGTSAAGALALIHAARLIGDGHVPACLVVAPAGELSPVEIAAFVRAGAMARGDAEVATTRCRPFDRARSGFAPAQIAAAVLLESASRAAGRGARPLGRLLGYGMVMDGRRGTGPDPAGQAEAMRRALAHAGLRGVDYVNAHATGSVAGDASEAAALRAVFPRAGPWINSTKGILGHGLAAAGLVETIATLLQLAGGYHHVNPNLDDPLDPDLRLTRERVSARSRTALSNSFAFGGINTSLVLAHPREGDPP
ncbi:beta-ketoacyl synthase N-terminal-like domain-containing protein (plasmid) [Streptomyces sp. BI20]|uniref:beta-ketoacyl synthase N-terminal-like domain-containing protein n=1 Tax=Streptomyces sp. BI20 TaxID=3403460 RepID=UPI003C76F543